MAERVRVDDATLQTVGAHLVAAANLMVAENMRRPSAELPSLIGIGSDVLRYVNGLQIARSALSRAAQSAGEVTAGMMQDSNALDREVAGILTGGFVARGGGR